MSDHETIEVGKPESEQVGPSAEAPAEPTVGASAEAPIEPAAETSIEPAAETSIEPAAEAPIEPAAETSIEPAAETSIEPAAEAPVEPAAEASVEPAAELGGEPPVKEKRGFPWRWVGAAATMLAVGTGCAFAVLAPQRTDLPGLATAPDGRYTFAPLTLPTLAPGQAAPTGTANAGQQHVSDIRKLLLAAPVGATADRSLPGTSGWVSRTSTVQLLANANGSEQLDTDGWRHTAGVAWKTPDGADTKIWLLQFIDGSAASDAYSAVVDTFDNDAVGLNSATITVNPSTEVTYNRVVKGATATYYGVAQVDDIDFVIVYTAPASIGLAPFTQEVDLQSELLQ
ncbi:MAG TPA: hypothetical protein VL551_30210 [Actinospica sp.]|jgi:hypothetical protein|nr:hypothetical protein [Actinospica sp.]